MKHTEKEIQELAERVYKEIGYDYFFPNSIRTRYSEDPSDLREGISRAWIVFADVPDEQFLNQKGSISLSINDENGEPYEFWDLSGGRIPPLKLSKDEKGKYYISGNWG